MGMIILITLAFFAVVSLVLAGWGVTIYNRLVAVFNNVKQAWSNIDVVLKQRSDELPKLIDVAKQYMEYEQETLEEVVKARQNVDGALEEKNVKKLDEAEQQMRNGLGKLFALAEDYPDLKAQSSFAELQERISDLEDKIADRREFYNESVNIYNIRIQQFPDVILANMLNYEENDLLSFSESERKDVDVNQMFE